MQETTQPILVTGATGKVGSRFVPRLLAAGHPVRALVRSPESAASLELRSAGAELVGGDLTAMGSAQLRAAVSGSAAVIHLAAAFRGGESAEQSAAINTHAAVALARAAREEGVLRFVFASTTLVYGGGHPGPQAEDSELRPHTLPSPYPASKAAAEAALAELQGLDLRIARLGFVYGDGDPHIAERFGQPMPRHAATRMHLVHHADVAQGLILALRTEGIAGEVFNIADDGPVSYAEILRYLGKTLPSEDIPLSDDPWSGIVDTHRARRHLGYRPLYPTIYQAMDAGAL
jgi:nucleoside-diphosphate-sugar epimerase